VFPEQWDSSLDTFAAALQHLATQDAAAAEGMSKQFEDLKQALLVPKHSHILHWHAIRCFYSRLQTEWRLPLTLSSRCSPITLFISCVKECGGGPQFVHQ